MKSLCLAALTAALFAMPTLAQERPPGPPSAPRLGPPARPQPLSPAQAETAWTIEASGVARELALQSEQAEQLAAAYKQARKSLHEAAESMRPERPERPEGGEPGERGGRGRFRGDRPDAGARMELLESERAKLHAALSQFLGAEQVEQAMVPLGAFSPQWDRMVLAISDMKLDTERSEAALKSIQQYVVALGALRGNPDRQTSRQQLLAARETLRDGLALVLTEEQMKSLQPAMRSGRRGGFGGRGGESPADMLATLDANGDGKIEKSEVPERMQERLFERFDANGDGVIVLEELEIMGDGGPPDRPLPLEL